MSVRISTALPGERDGLQALSGTLREEASGDVVRDVTVIATLRTREVRHRLDAPDDADPFVVVVELLEVEPLVGRQAATARGWLRRGYEDRTGKRALFVAE